jgi:glycosyltransferase involved in cell wall biosynthesis
MEIPGMRISVALCVYNGEKFLAEQLESIGRQERLPDELVICDDGSTDKSAALIEQFASRMNFPVRLHRNAANLGVTRNFEQAIGFCDGEVIVTADQDDVWFLGKLARIEVEFNRSPGVGLLFSDADLIDEHGRSLGSRLWPSVRFDEVRRRELHKGDGFGVLLRRPIITGATMAFRSSLRGLVLPISPSWLHDEWIGLMIAAVGRVLAISEPLMQYRRHSNNQVGVIGLNVAERAKASMARPRNDFLTRAEDFQELRSCLADRLPDRPDLLTRIDQKIAHYRVRGSLPSARLQRLPDILRELTTLRYSRYSGNTLSFARDFLSRH